MDDLAPVIAAIAHDRVSGASEILQRAIDVLRAAMSRPWTERLLIAQAICRAQPAMASIWNAAIAALENERHPGTFDRFIQRVARARSAIPRFARQVFSEPDTSHRRDKPLSLVTVSNSASVRQVIEDLAVTIRLRVACAEGRPALEGRRMAGALARAGIHVTLFSDAAISEALSASDAVLVGADAVTSDWFINKVGTRMLVASAAPLGVSVYVIASRDKFCGPALASHVIAPDGAAGEIWDEPAPGVVVRNPYFERVPVDSVLAVITDGGIMPAADVAAFCESLVTPARVEIVRQIVELPPKGGSHGGLLL